MDDPTTAFPIINCYPGKSVTAVFDMRAFLRSGVLVDTVTGITEVTSSDLTWSDEAKNGSNVTLEDGTVLSAGQAIVAKVAVASSASTGKKYSLIDWTTDDTPSSSPPARVIVNVLSKTG